MLHNLLKKQPKTKISRSSAPAPGDSDTKSLLPRKDGFKPKKNSTKGAARQRSIGGRNTKTG
jgi:hypothetical protein